ncbi:MAG: flagellar basal-body MS-ring/collar protein FliF [Alphaproteobacteria bacterium]
MNSFLETLKQLGPSKLAIMGAIMLGLLLFFVFVSFRVATPSMKLLYQDLSTIDSGAVVAELEANGVAYEVSADGARILVSEPDVGRARMLLAEKGLPNGGSLGYEIFDNQSGFGTTNFVQNINQVRALEGELSRTISSLENIRSARVHLVLPKRELFSRESQEARASVFLGIQRGAQLSRNNIAAIQSLVASAVAELKTANVSLIDSDGNLLAQGGQDGEDLMSMKAEERRLAFERRLTQKVEDQVARVVGYGNVRATVTAEMNFDRISTNEELYDPEGQVLRSSQTTEENALEREAPDNDVSVENNLPGIGNDLLLNEQQPSLENNRIEEVANYEISRTVRSTVREVGEIQKLAVAVLVDGRYTVNEEGERIYEPRNEEQLQQIEALVRTAIGYDDMRGDQLEVINMQFADIDTTPVGADDSMLLGFKKSDLLDTAEILTVAIMIILVVLLVLQPMVSRLLSSEGTEIDEGLEADLLAARPDSPALAAPDLEEPEGVNIEDDEDSMINITGVDGKVKASSIKKVEEIVENYPQETVSVIRSWMTQENQ